MCSQAGPAPGVIKPVWQVTIEEDSNEIEFKAAAVSARNESVWLLLGRRSLGSMSGPQTDSLDTLDRSGEFQGELSLATLGKIASLSQIPDNVIDIAALSNGNVAILTQAGARLFIVVLDGATRQFIVAKEVERVGSGALLTRAIAAESNTLLLIGRSDGRAVALKLDSNLNLLWKRSPEGAGVGVYTDATVLSDGTYVFAGTSLKHEGDPTSLSLWLERAKTDGRTETASYLPGRSMSVAPSANGGCSTIQHVIGNAGIDIWFKSYDQSLKETGSIKLLTGTKNFQTFQLARIPGSTNDFLVVGSDKQMIWLSRVTDGGSVVRYELSSRAGRPNDFPELLWNFGVRAGASSLIVPTTEMLVNAKLQQRQTVRIISIVP
jgi:hypothetical protein